MARYAGRFKRFGSGGRRRKTTKLYSKGMYYGLTEGERLKTRVNVAATRKFIGEERKRIAQSIPVDPVNYSAPKAAWSSYYKELKALKQRTFAAIKPYKDAIAKRKIMISSRMAPIVKDSYQKARSDVGKPDWRAPKA